MMQKKHMLLFIGSWHKFCVAAMFLCAFSSCGIEDYTYLYPAILVSTPHTPSDVSEQEDEWFFKFRQNSSNNDIDSYRGCEIFYRMYKGLDECKSDYSAISSYNSSETTQSTIYTYLTSQKKYCRLCLIPPDEVTTKSNVDTTTPLFKKDIDGDMLVRFINHSGNTNELARIEIIDGNDSTFAGLPARNPSAIVSSKNDKSFYGFVDEPDMTAEDLNTTTHGSDDFKDNTWYLSAWALSYGIDDSTYAPIYSIAVYLGTIQLKKD